MRILTYCAAWFVLTTLPMNAASLYDIPLKDIDKNDTSLRAYDGKVLLIVNVASKCGFTRQYAGLEELNRKYGEKGFVVLGFPCNQFGGQEPGTNEEIKAFCSSTFDVTFPLFDKIDVNGADRHPLYQELVGPSSPVKGDIKWNFTKILISRDGTILARFESRTEPDSAELVGAIETALASSASASTD